MSEEKTLNDAMHDLMIIQGRIRIALVKAGVADDESMDLCAIITEMVIKSDIPRQPYRQAWELAFAKEEIPEEAWGAPPEGKEPSDQELDLIEGGFAIPAEGEGYDSERLLGE